MRDEAILGAGLPGRCLKSLWDLMDGLNSEGISYCYWKSSRRLATVLAGESDLDLLVDRAAQHRAHATLIQRGFKLFPSSPFMADPSIVSYIGYDEPSSRITHVDMHTRLSVGAKLLPNYRLPWERNFLAKARLHPLFPVLVLDPADEAVLLVVRACLEFRYHDPVTVRHWQAVAKKFADDRATLAQQVERLNLRRRAVALLGADAADLIVRAFYDAQPLHRNRRLRRQIREEVASYRMYCRAEAGVRSAVRAGFAAAASLNQQVLHTPRSWRRSAPGGGIVVAVLGVDGSGKTTAVRSMQNWLKAEVDTMPVYFGTGDGRPSFVLMPLKLLLPVFTKVFTSRPHGSSHGQVTSRRPGLFYTVALAFWASILACEKRSKLKAARRGADRGLVVIADRYPQDQIASFNDGPLLPRLSWIPGWLRQFEARSYALARKLPPDLVFKLRADPELIAKREPTMDRGVIERRVAEFDQLLFPDATVVCLDAAQPAAQVAQAIRHEIWQLL